MHGHVMVLPRHPWACVPRGVRDILGQGPQQLCLHHETNVQLLGEVIDMMWGLIEIEKLFDETRRHVSAQGWERRNQIIGSVTPEMCAEALRAVGPDVSLSRAQLGARNP